MPAFAQQAASAYRQTEVQSRTPLELVVMLYDGALRFVGQARDAVGRKDIPARRTAISRAMAILSELQSTLDMDKGGVISEKLDGLYVYISGLLIDASMTQSARPLEEAARLLTTLRDSWSAIARETAAAAPGQVTR
jgi:flagellar protein FliS